MTEKEWLAGKFEENRGHLRAVAYRMLGSLNDADDAIQETWLRLNGSDAAGIENLGGWLTTVVARVCLDMLRSRKSRREDEIDAQPSRPGTLHSAMANPEQEALMADSVGLALLIVLDRLKPSERLAFVLHDIFGASFEEIGGIVGRSPEAARQLASRARRRVQGAPLPDTEIALQRKVVGKFLEALRAADFEAMIAVLDPNVHVHLDEAGARPGGPTEIHGAANWARGAVTFSHAAPFTRAMLVNGSVGLVWAPAGRLLRAVTFGFANGKIATVDVVADPKRLRELDLAVLQD